MVGGVEGFNFIINFNLVVVCDLFLMVFFVNFMFIEGIIFSWDFDNGNIFDGFNLFVEIYIESG